MMHVGPAPTGRATCRLCGQRVARGELRVDVVTHACLRPEQQSYHVRCVRKLLPREPGTRPTARKTFMEPAPNMGMGERRLKQFEVTFRDMTGGDRFSEEYGFGANPPAVFDAESEDELRKQLAPKLERDNVRIASIREVPR